MITELSQAHVLQWTFRSSPSTHLSHLVDIRDLNFGYNERPILAGLTMQFARGKVIAVMGGSGCGQTTGLRLIGWLNHAPAGGGWGVV